ncbi:MAG: HigA family addiction module antidote protein [Prevotellaceae bacterium]|jgi:addiction module HigA family antidote|nr:HigA family addiction module antidote protein [Prevotellaceae bacterium]
MWNLRYGFTPTHPGEVLKDEIEYRGISQQLLAKQMGMSYKALNDILNQRRPLTPTTAMLFEAALGISAGLIMRLQLKYNMQAVSHDKKLASRLGEIRKACAVL